MQGVSSSEFHGGTIRNFTPCLTDTGPHDHRHSFMTTLHFLALVAVAFLSGTANSAAVSLDIRVQDGGWGQITAKEVRAIALGAAKEIARHCPKTRMDPILVHHRDDHPQTAWVRTPDGRIIVGLQARDRQCAQLAFQFAHEFCHVLATQSNDWQRTWRAEGKPNLWLEESFAEAASLFALRAMARTWQRSAPFRNWRSYAPEFADYAAERMRTATGGGHADFVRWFRPNEPVMRRNPTLRERNSVVC